MSWWVMTPGVAAAGLSAFPLTSFSIASMPVGPLIGMAPSRQIFMPFHSPGLCDAVIMMLASAPRLPFA